MPNLNNFPKKSLSFKYKESIERIKSDPLFSSTYKKISDKHKVNVFLSIVIRTQGKRNALLNKNLTSLSKQTCKDFEVIIIGHNIDKQKREEVKKIIASQDKQLKQKIYYYSVKGGKISKLLNYAYAHANGKYAVSLDDDDFAYEDFVETYKKAAKENDGKIIHTYCDCQDWYFNEKGEYYPRSELRKNFYIDFDYTNQMIDNKCPFNSLAFPTFYFKKLGIIFDEKLDVLEDYDYLMRIAALSGVVNIKHSTSIYCNWLNINNTKNSKATTEWQNNREYIKGKMNNNVLYKELGISNSESNVLKLRKEIDELQKEKLILLQKNQYLEEENKEILNSTIWKTTKPLRKLLDIFKK